MTGPPPRLALSAPSPPRVSCPVAPLAFLPVRPHGPSFHFWQAMTNREETLLAGRVKRIEQILGYPLTPVASASDHPLQPGERAYMRDSAEELYWNELEWEKLTGEEKLDEDFLTALAFPGFLAFVRGLLLTETLPDSSTEPRPSPEVVEEVLGFLAQRVVELEEEMAGLEGEERAHRETELTMTSRLIDLVLYLLYGLDPAEVGKVEATLLSE